MSAVVKRVNGSTESLVNDGPVLAEVDYAAAVGMWGVETAHRIFADRDEKDNSGGSDGQ